jgi:hypothetical protein
MRGAILPLHQYTFMAWCLVKQRDNFTFLLIFISNHIHREEETLIEVENVGLKSEQADSLPLKY